MKISQNDIKLNENKLKFDQLAIQPTQKILLCISDSLYTPNTPITINYVPRPINLDYRR